MKIYITFIENDQRQGEISRWKHVLPFIEMKRNKTAQKKDDEYPVANKEGTQEKKKVKRKKTRKWKKKKSDLSWVGGRKIIQNGITNQQNK